MANADNGDALAPTAASNLAVNERTASSLTVSWADASDTGGSGLDRYAVTVDGSVVQTVDASTTQATVSGLSAETSYDVGVTAFDAANNESYTVVTSASTEAAGSDGSGTGSGSGGSGSGGETGSGTGSGSGGETGSGSSTDSGTDSGSDSGGSGWWGSGSGSDTGSDSGSDSGSGWWGSSSGSDSGSDSGGWW